MDRFLDLQNRERADRLRLRRFQRHLSLRPFEGFERLHHVPLNPAAFQGVLVKESDLENTTYKFELEDGSVIEVKGNEEIEYDGETHSAANLFDALKEGYYGKF